MNINSIRGKKLELLVFLDFHQPHVVAIQEKKKTALLQLQNYFRKLAHTVYTEKNRNLPGGGVMLLLHKDIQYMPIKELENNLESVLVKVFANKTSR